MNKIYTPFSEKQVDKLSAYQQNGRAHPYTCPDGYPLLVNTSGLWCAHCSYAQKWAWDT